MRADPLPAIGPLTQEKGDNPSNLCSQAGKAVLSSFPRAPALVKDELSWKIIEFMSALKP